MTKTIDFNDLSTGTIVDNEYVAHGVTVSGFTNQSAPNRAMIFDSANPTGGDWDLHTSNLGNVLIVSEDGDGDDPDDNARGGLLRFDFNSGANVKSLTFLDVEEGAVIKFYDAHGNLIKKSSAYTEDNGQVVAHLNVDGVFRMDVYVNGSGAVDNLVFDDIINLDGTVEGAAGDDVIDANYANDPDGDRVDNDDAILPGTTGDDDLIYGFEGNDVIRAGDGDDEIYGGTGDDSIDGGRGDDLIFGGTGDDTITGVGGTDTVYGGEGHDTVAGGNESDVLYGGNGSDDISGRAGDDVVKGGNGNDNLSGNGGDDTLFGGRGDDVLSLGDGVDIAYAGDDADRILATGGDFVYGGAGADDNDVLDITGQGAFILTGPTGDGSPIPDSNGNGFDGCVVFLDENGDPDGRVIEFREIEEIKGDAPLNQSPIAVDDSAFAEENSVTDFDSVLTNDTDPDGDDLTVVAVNGDAANVGVAVLGDNGGLFTINPDGTVNFDANGDFDGLGLGQSQDTTVSYTITDTDGATDTANITFTVTGKSDGTVQGTFGDDVIAADVPFVDADGDAIDSSDGILPGDEGTDNDLIDALNGNDSVDAGAGDDRVFGGSDNDTIEGSSGDDQLFGGSGRDTITDSAGQEEVFGGTGHDFIDVSGPDATAAPDVGYPFQTPDPASGNPIPFPGYPADADPTNDKDTVFGGAGDDRIITGDDDDFIDGGEGSDRISAGFDDDTVYGRSGFDLIEGGEGNDYVEGGTGDDVIFGGLEDPIADFVSFPDDEPDANGFQDLVPENNGDTIYGGEGNDSIYGQDDEDTLFGDAGNDYVDGGVDDDIIALGDGNDTGLGGQGDDVIEGGQGTDQIIGGEGADALFGGSGSDLFIGGTAGDVVVGGEDLDGQDSDVLDLSGSDVDRVEFVNGDPEAGTVFFNNGTTMTFSEIENVVPCFTPGTLIATPRGERAVEDLKVGDRVITRDNGIQEIAWVGHKRITGQQLVQNPHLTPILIKRGALGQGLPERDMMVSPNHRMLVASDKTQLYFEETEVLAAAKHMIGASGIHAVDVMATTYIHFMFERHEVVLSNGAWTESFQPGDYTLKGIGNSQRNEILDLFPDLATQEGLENYHSARKSLKKHEAKLLLD
ncbi:MAG: Hint domain-containing protein [Pseudomonadota bacterium]